MTRPKNRRSLRFENLESRNLLSSMATTPTADQQYMLEIINQARTNPKAAAERLTSSITPALQNTLKYYNVDVNAVAQEIASAPAKPALAWNPELASAAQAHSQDMANNDFQSHTGSDGSIAQDRMEKAGYTNPVRSGENAYAYANSVDNAMQAFLIDWGVPDHGHLRNIQQFNSPEGESYNDVGIGLVSTSSSSSSSSVGPLLVTQDFGSKPNEQAQLVGVAYYDNKHTGLYVIGEGKGNVQIDATNLATGQTTSTQTWDAGGYQIPLSAGQYEVTASYNGTVIQTVNLTVGNENVKQDFLLNRAWDNRSLSQVESPISPARSQTNSASDWKSATVSAPALATSSTSDSSSNSTSSLNSTPNSNSSSSSSSTSSKSSTTSATSQNSTSSSAAKSSPAAAPASSPTVDYKPTDSTGWMTWKAQLN
jgi:uncharacterized protein YkwD